MKFIFTLFTLFLLILVELWVGTRGIYLPLCGLGIFYFSLILNWKWSLIAWLICGFILDFCLYDRIFAPDLLLFGIIWGTVQRLQVSGEKRNRLIFNALCGALCFFVFNLAHGILALWRGSLSWLDLLALSASSILPGFLIMLFLDWLLNKIAGMLKIDLPKRPDVQKKVRIKLK